MATKKYMSLERLTEYDELIKNKIDAGDAATLASAKSYTNTEVAKKADSSHTHDDRYYTETEVDGKISAINTSITNITSGTTVVKNAEHATNADNATNANHATSADSATHASTLGSTTDDTGSTTIPIYLKAGVATKASTYAGGTKVTLNGANKGSSTASFYAPTGAGTSGYILKSNGSGAPTWLQTLPVANGGTGATTADAARTNLDVYSKSEVDTALSGKSDSGHKHDNDYDVKGAANTALASAKTYADNAAAGVKNDLLNGAGAAYDTLKELGDLIDTNKGAIEALETIASGKADADHDHAIADVTGLQDALDGKAAASHGTHVSFDSTNKPKMNGTSAFGTSSKVARADHVHPTDTSRASQTDLDALEAVVNGKANTSHTHELDDITDITATATELNYMSGVTSGVQSQLNAKATTSALTTHTNNADIHFTAAERTKLAGIATNANKTTVDTALSSTSTNPVQNKVVNSAITTATSAITANTNSINAHSTAITNLQTAISEIQEITSADIQNLFK